MTFKRFSYRHGLILILILIALLVPARALFLGRNVTTLAPRREDLLETVVSSGRVIAPVRVTLGAEMVGRVVDVLVEEGDRVRAGQVLARLRDEELRAALDQAEHGVDEAQAKLAELREVVRPVAEQALMQAQANEVQARAQYARVKKLTDAGFYNQSSLDDALRGLEAARAAREAAVAQARGNRPDGVEFSLDMARLAQARAALGVAQARQANTVIRSPAAGMVLKKLVEQGDVVTQGKLLFDLAMDGETQVDLQVDEKNLGLLHIGQEASVLADAYPARPFSAQIFYIAPAIDAEKGSVEVKLRVRTPPAFIKPDMTVSVEIKVGERHGALSLPTAVVHDAASGHPWVLLIAAGHAVRRPVTLGLRGTGAVEVVSGLEGKEAIIPPDAPVAAGDRVHSDR